MGVWQGIRRGNTRMWGATGIQFITDYMIGGEEVRGRVKMLEVREQIDLDHQPLMVYVKEKGTRENGKAK